jgi:glycosyltransferase involved in cell wall biosynthesis
MWVLTRTGDSRFYPARPVRPSCAQHDKIEPVEGQVEDCQGIRIAHLTTADISLALLLSTELAEALEEGYEVIGVSAPGPYVERVEALGVRHVPIPELTRSWGLGQDLRALVALYRTFRELDLDVLHTHNPKTGVMGRIAGRLARVPVVVNTCHGLWATPDDSLVKRAFVYGLEGLAARFSDYELFQNEQDERTLLPFLKEGRHKVVGNGIDLTKFRFDPEARDRLRAKWGVAKDEILVGTVGRRVREKGSAEFAAAAATLGKRGHFVWVGPADDTDPDAQAAPHTGPVQFIPEQTDMPAVYSAFDIFVLASYREGFSRASMEAAACGRPLVLTDIRGCREIGQHEEHLLLVAPRSAQSIAHALTRLLDDESLRTRLGEAAAERAHREFDQRAIARMSRETYALARERRGVSTTSRPGYGESRRVTVLHVLPTDINRGAQVYAGQLREAFADDPEQHHLVVSLFEEPDSTHAADIRLRTPSAPLRRAGLDPRAVRLLKRAIDNLHADVVVAHGGEALKYVVPAATRAHVVYYKVGLSSRELSRPSRRRLYRYLAGRTTRVVGVSHAILGQAHEVLEVPWDKLHLIPNGRDPHTYHPPTGIDRTAEPPLVLFVGQFEEGKRPRLFLDVVELLRSRGLDFDASMVGDGPLRSHLEHRAEDLGVTMLGVRTDVPELLRAAAVLVVSSAADSEGMPGVLIEAGLSGLAAVSTKAAGVEDVIIDSETGFVSRSDLPEDLADSVAVLLGDSHMRKTMGAAARLRCTRHFSIESTAQRWRDLVDELVPAPVERGNVRLSVRERGKNMVEAE